MSCWQHETNKKESNEQYKKILHGLAILPMSTGKDDQEISTTIKIKDTRSLPKSYEQDYIYLPKP